MRFTLQSICAGIFIGLGAMVYMATPGIIGAILFSIGLMGVVKYDCLLFTGKVGYMMEDKRTVWNVTKMLLLNAVGIALTCYVLSCYMPEKFTGTAADICLSRMNSTKDIFLGSIGCGMLMSFAVYGFRTEEKDKGILPYLNILFAVPVFIMCGFPHCIADVGYYTVCLAHATSTTWTSAVCFFLLWIMTICGNVVGCTIMGDIARLLKLSKN